MQMERSYAYLNMKLMYKNNFDTSKIGTIDWFKKYFLKGYELFTNKFVADETET